VAVPATLGAFLSGFALGEGSFMVVCRMRAGTLRGFRISTAFNVSQQDRAPLDLFRETLACGTMRRAGNGGWCWEVIRLAAPGGADRAVLRAVPARGPEATDFEASERRSAAGIEASGVRLGSRHGSSAQRGMSRGGKRKYRMDGILRGHTPTPPAEQPAG
jgi:hypothetical protein